jgi:hypothetical protein
VNAFSHEDPILLVLPDREPLASALPAVLDHPDLRHHALPPLWAFDRAGIDLPAALAGCRSLTRDTLEEVVEALLRLCDAEHLDGLVRRAWADVDERVRQHYLSLSIGQTFATIFKVAPATLERPIPDAFREDRIHENGFEIQYRLAPETDVPDFRAPEHEGSLVFYPFDPANEAARREAGLGPGTGAVIEAFAYEPARARHREFLEAVAREHGWQVVEPRDASA